MSDEGRRHAQAVASSLKDKELGAIFCSPLLRTSQTARAILAAHPGLVLHPSRLLIEVHSPYDGRPNQELRERSWDIYSGVPAGYEQPEDVLRRTLKFVAKIRRRYAGQHVVAVTHGDVIAFIILWAHGVPVTRRQAGPATLRGAGRIPGTGVNDNIDIQDRRPGRAAGQRVPEQLVRRNGIKNKKRLCGTFFVLRYYLVF